MADDYSYPWGIKPGLQDLSQGLVAGKPEDVVFLGQASRTHTNIGSTAILDIDTIGFQEGDLAVVFGAGFQNPSTIGPGVGVTGWTTRLLKAHGTSNNEIYYAVWTKIMTTAPDEEFKMDGSPSTCNGSIMCMGFRNVNEALPIAGSISFRHDTASSTWNGAPTSTSNQVGARAIMGGKSDPSTSMAMTGGYATPFGSAGAQESVWGSWKPVPTTGASVGSTWTGWTADSRSFGCVSIPIRRR